MGLGSLAFVIEGTTVIKLTSTRYYPIEKAETVLGNQSPYVQSKAIIRELLFTTKKNNTHIMPEMYGLSDLINLSYFFLGQVRQRLC